MKGVAVAEIFLSDFEALDAFVSHVNHADCHPEFICASLWTGHDIVGTVCDPTPDSEAVFAPDLIADVRLLFVVRQHTGLSGNQLFAETALADGSGKCIRWIIPSAVGLVKQVA